MPRPLSRRSFLATPCWLTLSVLAAATLQQGDGLGYQDTPLVRGYHVHDGQRPQPPIVRPAPSVGGAPSDATVLFDGTSLEAWKGAKGDAAWKLIDGAALEVVRGAGAIQTREHFGDCQLHLEWRTPAPGRGKGQGRSNSGVFFCGRYEVQVLDSYENQTYPDGQAAAMYGQWPPRVNASREPGAWQSYDIVFEAPRYDAKGANLSPAFVTVFHNGVCVHHRQAFDGPTAHRSAARYGKPPRVDASGQEVGPLSLQDHGDPVAFRNIWVRPLPGYDAAAGRAAVKQEGGGEGK